jgi:Flp pilus assembly protein TadD
MGLQQYDSAIAQFREAVMLEPKSSGPQFALGQAQLKAGQYADAGTTYRHLVTQFPNDPRAQAALAYASRQARQAPPQSSAVPPN